MTSDLVQAVEAAARRVGDDAVAASTLAAGDRPAGRSLTYGELLAESDRVAAGLAARGLRPGDTIGVYLPNIPEWLVLELAAARCGLRIAPINTRYRVSEVAGILRDTDVRAVVVATDFLELDLPGVLTAAIDAQPAGPLVVTVALGPAGGTDGPPGAVPYAELAASAANQTPPGAGDDPTRTINLLFSSGTTSSPKVVGHHQQSLLTRFSAAVQRFDVRPGDAVLCVLPLCGVWGLGLALTTLIGGGRAVLAPVFDAAAIARAIAAERVTHVHGGDDMVRAILSSPALDPAGCQAWRSVTFGNFSGRDPSDLVATIPGLDRVEISGVYGASEALSFIAADPPGAGPAERAQAGGQLVDAVTQARIVDPESGELRPVGEAGELQLRGPVVASAYLGNPQATAEAFGSDGWYRSGDLALIDERDRIVFLARLKDTLRLRGFLVDPREIEEFIIDVGHITAAQVVRVDDSELGEVVVAFVRADPGDPDLEDRVITACRSGLARFKVPAAVEVVDEFPTVDAPNGRKIQRAQLREDAIRVLADRRASRQSPQSPPTALS